MSLDTLTISEAAPDDAERILATQRLAFEVQAQLYQDWNIPPLTETADEIRQAIATQLVLIAQDGPSLVGSVRVRVEGDTAHIGRLFVHPDYRGRGLGKRLMEAAEAHVPHARRMELFTGWKSERNLNLYRSLGYTQFGEGVDKSGVRVLYLEKCVETRPGSVSLSGSGSSVQDSAKGHVT
jgi:ribosomal protein S18 acetylase RimI-like enzyme